MKLNSDGQALENAILANPDDLGAHAAFADWLIEQGLPLGEFIQVAIALADEQTSAPERKKLQKRQQALLKKHRQEWREELHAYFLGQKDRQWRHDVYCEYLFAHLLPLVEYLIKQK